MRRTACSRAVNAATKIASLAEPRNQNTFEQMKSIYLTEHMAHFSLQIGCNLMKNFFFCLEIVFFFFFYLEIVFLFIWKLRS